jgi:hypothetical protein
MGTFLGSCKNFTSERLFHNTHGLFHHILPRRGFVYQPGATPLVTTHFFLAWRVSVAKKDVHSGGPVSRRGRKDVIRFPMRFLCGIGLARWYVEGSRKDRKDVIRFPLCFLCVGSV